MKLTRRRDKLVVVGDRRVVYKSVCDHCVLQEAVYSSDFQSFVFGLCIEGLMDFVPREQIGRLSRDKARWKEL
jgi:hypothetical protein